MTTSASEFESKLIVLKSLQNEIEEALKTDKKWVSVIDAEGNAEIFFKYQGTSIFSILEKEIAPENLCRSLLTMVKYPRTLTVNYLDLPYYNIFNEQYFPEEILDVDWVMDFNNIERLRQNFLQEFPEEIWPCKDFKMCFLFRKDNVPELLHKKTNVIEICPPSEISERREQREALQKEREASQASQAKQEEEKKVEEPKVEAKKATVTSKSSSSSTGKSSTTVKTQAKASVSVTTKAGTTTKTSSIPVKTTTTTSTSGKSASGTGTAKTSVTAKVTKK